MEVLNRETLHQKTGWSKDECDVLIKCLLLHKIVLISETDYLNYLWKESVQEDDLK